MKQREFVSTVLPAHNEAAGLQNAVVVIMEQLRQGNVDFEIIIVDDGSSDDTYAVIEQLAAEYPAIRGLRLSRNFGKEAALLAGLDQARGDAVITMDADLQHPPVLIPKMIDLWRGGYKIVNAVKADRSTDSAVARMRARVFNLLMTRLGGVDLQNSSDFKLLDRVAVDVLVKQLPERSRFYRGLSDWVGFRSTTIPFSVEERAAGVGKWSLLKLLELAVTALVSFTSAPLRIITILGSATLVFGLAVASDALWSWFHGRAVSGFVTMIITLLLIGSFIMISLGVIGEYIAKIYEEIKARPVYLVDSICGSNNRDGPAGSAMQVLPGEIGEGPAAVTKKVPTQYSQGGDDLRHQVVNAELFGK